MSEEITNVVVSRIKLLAAVGSIGLVIVAVGLFVGMFLLSLPLAIVTDTFDLGFHWDLDDGVEVGRYFISVMLMGGAFIFIITVLEVITIVSWKLLRRYVWKY